LNSKTHPLSIFHRKISFESAEFLDNLDFFLKKKKKKKKKEIKKKKSTKLQLFLSPIKEKSINKCKVDLNWNGEPSWPDPDPDPEGHRWGGKVYKGQ
jgi:hypothetical protein